MRGRDEGVRGRDGVWKRGSEGGGVRRRTMSEEMGEEGVRRKERKRDDFALRTYLYFLPLIYVCSIGDGFWAYDGVNLTSVETVNGKTMVNCSATHLTSFAVLVSVSGSLTVRTYTP